MRGRVRAPLFVACAELHRLGVSGRGDDLVAGIDRDADKVVEVVTCSGLHVLSIDALIGRKKMSFLIIIYWIGCVIETPSLCREEFPYSVGK